MLHSNFWKRTLWLMLLAWVGIMITLLLGVTFFAPLGHGAMYFHALQWLQTLLVMILPAWIWTRWTPINLMFTSPWINVRHERRPWSELGMHRASWQWWVLTAMLMLVSIPVMSALVLWCESLPYPEALRQMADRQAVLNGQVLTQLLAPEGVGAWVEQVLLMCVATAIGEELMFRGAIRNLLEGETSMRRHSIAVVIGLVFSLIHFDVYGLIPRWLLGTLFVYLYYWSGSLWIPILAHALNNLTALIDYKLNPEAAALSQEPMQFPWWIVVVSALTTAALLRVMYCKGNRSAVR